MSDVKKKRIKTQTSLLLQQKSELEVAKKNLSLDQLKTAEDKLFADSLQTLEHCMNFAALGFDESGNVNEDQIPEEWKRLSNDEKKKRIRLAKANWLPSNEVPHGIKMAHQTVMGIIKARAHADSGDKIINIETASFPAPAPLKGDFDIIDVEE